MNNAEIKNSLGNGLAQDNLLVYVNDGGTIRSIEFMENINGVLQADVKPYDKENKESILVEELYMVLASTENYANVQVYIPENKSKQDVKSVDVVCGDNDVVVVHLSI